MRSLDLAGIEFRRLTGERMVRAAILVITLVPLLYGALYLWAFWNPYDRLDKLPVALVNEDRAVTVDGRRLNAGADLVKKLRESGTFGWREVSLAEAQAGLKDGRYYMALEIPEDFSADLGTANSAKPVRARLKVVDHEGANLLATQIGGRVFTEVRAAVSATAARTYLDNVYVGFSDARGGLVDAAAGSRDLAAGLTDAEEGAKRLADGEAQARDGASDLSDGLGRLADGAATADDGARQVAAGSFSLTKGLAEAFAGATGVSDGASQVASGTATLATGAQKLAAGGKALASSADRLSAGAGTLASGASQLAAGGASLAGSADALSAGASQLSSGVDSAVGQIGTAVSGSAQVRDGAAGVYALLNAYLAAHPEAAVDTDFATALATAGAVKTGSADLASGLSAVAASGPTLAGGAHQVAAGSAQLAAGAHQLSGGLLAALTGTQQLAAGASALSGGSAALGAGIDDAAAGSAKLATGAQALAGGSAQLAAGIGTATDGSRRITAGSAALAAGTSRLASGASDASVGSRSLLSGLIELSDGADDLAGGLVTARDGSRRLADGLSDGSEQIPSFSASEQAANAKMMSDPVGLDTARMNEVPNYGTGFAPYFIPLALWVGALMTYFIVRPLPERALASGASARAAAFAGYWPGAAVGSVQAVVLSAVLMLALGLKPVSPLLFIGYTVLSALAFIAVLQFLSAALGSAVGKITSIVLLMLQLTSAAGTFPFETLPPFFQVINPWLPMTYVVSGLRQAISGGDWRALALDAAVLVGYSVLALAGTMIAARRKQVWTMDRLRPAFEL